MACSSYEEVKKMIRIKLGDGEYQVGTLDAEQLRCVVALFRAAPLKAPFLVLDLAFEQGAPPRSIDHLVDIVPDGIGEIVAAAQAVFDGSIAAIKAAELSAARTIH